MSAVRDAIHRIRLATDVRLSDALVVEDALLTPDEAALCLELQYAESLVYTTTGNEAFVAKLKRIAGDS